MPCRVEIGLTEMYAAVTAAGHHNADDRLIDNPSTQDPDSEFNGLQRNAIQHPSLLSHDRKESFGSLVVEEKSP